MPTKYILTYEQPYEVDDDSPSGIGDHSICWSRRTAVIDEEMCKVEDKFLTDLLAKRSSIDFLNKDSIVFNHFIDGDGLNHYRRFISLIKIVETDIPISLVEIHGPIMKAALSN